MSAETQAREVKVGETRYVVSDETVFLQFSDVQSDGYFLDGSQAAAIRRIAELEEERERVWEEARGVLQRLHTGSEGDGYGDTVVDAGAFREATVWLDTLANGGPA